MKTSMVLPIVMIGLFVVVLVSGAGYAAVRSECPTLQEMTSNGVKYMSGGVSADERERITYMPMGYNLGLAFSKRSGQYLSDAVVTIKGMDNKVYLRTESCGPWFFAELPQGQYRVMVAHGVDRQVRDVSMGTDTRTMEFRFRGVY
jgi:hypothetical protein